MGFEPKLIKSEGHIAAALQSAMTQELQLAGEQFLIKALNEFQALLHKKVGEIVARATVQVVSQVAPKGGASEITISVTIPVVQ